MQLANNESESAQTQGISNSAVINNEDTDRIYRVVSQLGFSKLSLQKYGNYSFPCHAIAVKSIASFFYHDDFMTLLHKSIAAKTHKISHKFLFSTRVNNKQQICIQPMFEKQLKKWLDELGIRYTVNKIEQIHNKIHIEFYAFSIVNQYPKQDLMVNYLVALYLIYLEV